MSQKIEIEQAVASDLIARITCAPVKKDDLVLGNHIKSEPDIICRDMGVELGAVLSQTNIEIDKYEKQFFEKINQLVRGRIHSALLIKLLFQEDCDKFSYAPSKEFENYPLLTKYLRGLYLHCCDRLIEKQIIIHSKSLMRERNFPNINKRELTKFLAELTDFINKIEPGEFIKIAHLTREARCDSYVTYYNISDSSWDEKNINILDDFFSPKILEKLRKRKYEGEFSKLFLVLHNYSSLKNEILSSDMHFYSHHKDEIFNYVFDIIAEHKSFELYDEIFFADYSLYPDFNNFDLIDFSTYERKNLSESANNGIHIRIPLA